MVGIQNDEPKVIRSAHADTGCCSSPTRPSASTPIFWQSICLGDNDYGVLERFDEQTIRRVDNVGFFSEDDIERIRDQKLYDRVLMEFPRWIKTAPAGGSLR